MTGKWIFVILAAALLVVVGCVGCIGGSSVSSSGGSSGQAKPLPELVARSQTPIPDLPVPIGFKLDEGKSRDFAAAGARYIDHVYRGWSDKFSVARFYKRQMPPARWVLVICLFVQGDIMLDFEKETERCRVIVTRHGLIKPTRVKLQLWTSGQIQTAGVVPKKK